MDIHELRLRGLQLSKQMSLELANKMNDKEFDDVESSAKESIKIEILTQMLGAVLCRLSLDAQFDVLELFVKKVKDDLASFNRSMHGMKMK
jgi:hypothetical protein